MLIMILGSRVVAVSSGIGCGNDMEKLTSPGSIDIFKSVIDYY